MWNEYAVEPSALRTYSDLRYVVEKFGYSHGRLLSKFPSDWIRQVHAALHDLPDVQRLAATQLLRRLKADGLESFGRQFMPGSSWVANAIRENSIRAFGAIIAAQSAEGCISVDDLTEERLACPRSVRVIASAANLCVPMTLLLRCEPELVFVDPYWRVSRPKYRAVMQQMLAIASEGKCRTLTFVCRAGDEAEEIAHVRRLIQTNFGDWLRSGFTIRACQVADSMTEHKLHARYVIGQRAGLRYDKGFDESPAEKVEIGIMDGPLHDEVRALYFDRRHPGFSTATETVLPTVENRGFRFG